ncbi:superinfection immunity protein [Neoasaia chiangmaiensis]|nr:superinfection immunity protein [Neoasaia chiangmaiensis]
MRGVNRLASVLVVNAFLGWTLIGWGCHPHSFGRSICICSRT